MKDDKSRRQFLRWMGLSSGALLLTGLGCNGDGSGGSDTGTENDAGTNDAGGVDSGSSDVGEVACEPTGSDILGPFHEEGAPQRAVLADAEEPGERLVIEGTVYEEDCTTPIADALLDVWHADINGDYHGGSEDEYRLRGQVHTDEEGYYRLETIRPGHYPMDTAGELIRPAHIHFTITKPGFTPLTTQMYFQDDPHLAPDDPCATCNSGDPTLIVELSESDAEDGWHGTFDIVLES